MVKGVIPARLIDGVSGVVPKYALLILGYRIL